MQPADPKPLLAQRRLTSQTYQAEAHLLSGQLIRPIEQKLERQAYVQIRDARANHLVRYVEQINVEELIAFQSGYTSVSGSRSPQHLGWVTLSRSVIRSLNLFEVITAERVVAQVSTESEGNVPSVTFLGTRFETLRVAGYPVLVEFDLGICGNKPSNLSYLEDAAFLDRVYHQLEEIVYAKDLPKHLKEEYDFKIQNLHKLRENANRRKAGEYQSSLKCSLVKRIAPIPIPGVRTVGNLILIPDFGVVSLGDVEVGTRPSHYDVHDAPDGGPPLDYFKLTMLGITMGSIAHGDLLVAEAEVGNTRTVGNPEEPSQVPSRESSALAEIGALEGTSVTRYPDIDLTVEDRLTREVLVTIDLGLLPDPGTESTGMQITAPEGWTELQIQTQITAPALQFNPGEDSGTIVIRNGAASVPHSVKAWVTDDLREQQPIEVRATFYYEGRNCGTARRAFAIAESPLPMSFETKEASETPALTTPYARELQPPPDKVLEEVRAMELPKKSIIPQSQHEFSPTEHTAGSMVASFNERPPILTIEIHVFDWKKKGQQRWHLRVPERVRDECVLPGNLTADIDLKKDEPAYVANLFQTLDSIDPGQHMTFFQGLGDDLYEMTPSCFKELYWVLFDKYGHFPIQILSDDPYVPWELMRPTRREGDQRETDPEILARRHPLGRWFLNKEGFRLTKLKSGKVATIAPDYSKRRLKGLKPLLSAQTESNTICSKLGSHAIRITGRKQNVIEMFEDARKEDIGLVHYAGHGASKIKKAKFAQLLLEDTDLLVYDIRRKETQLGRNRHSLVFFNACEVGVSGLNLGVIGGFAEALIEDRFGGFVAPLWSVYDVDATTVVLEFLENVLLTDKAQRQTFAGALQKIRNEYGEQSPTFLSYTYYGDVMATFV